MQPYQKNSATSILPCASIGCGGSTSVKLERGCAIDANGAAASAARRLRRSGFMSLMLLLDLDQARVDAVLRQRLPDAVDVLDLRVRPHAHPVPGALVGQVRRLDARLEAEDRQARLLVVGVGGVLERARLDE